MRLNPKEDDTQSRFLRLYTAHEATLHSYVRRLVYSREDTLDVMQKIAVVLWKKFDQLKEDQDFRKWSFAVARFEVLAWRRDLAREREKFVLSSDTIELMAGEMDQQAEQLDLQQEAILQHCLKKLTETESTALKKMYQKKRDTATLAEEFNKSITGFYQWIYRIRQNLAKCAQNLSTSI